VKTEQSDWLCFGKYLDGPINVRSGYFGIRAQMPQGGQPG